MPLIRFSALAEDLKDGPRPPSGGFLWHRRGSVIAVTADQSARQTRFLDRLSRMWVEKWQRKDDSQE